jgi:hypothetical protein
MRHSTELENQPSMHEYKFTCPIMEAAAAAAS